MFKTFKNILTVPELRNKILFTLLMLLIYRVGYHITIPGADQAAFAELAKKQAEDAGVAGRIQNYVSLFSGGDLSQSTIFGLGVMPYITASIVFQLLVTVVPALEKLQKEGETGRRKIQEWTRYATVPLALVQSIMWIGYMHNAQLPLVQREFAGTLTFWVTGVLCLTAGAIFLMWLGEQIDEYGLGNGISLIILAGIVSRMPGAVFELVSLTNFSAVPDAAKPLGVGHILALIVSFVVIVSGAILMTQAQRRIPIQQAKHMRGRRVYGGQKQYLPLRVNHGGVMPVIFAQSIMMIPAMIFGSMVAAFPASGWFTSGLTILDNEFRYGSFLYLVTEVAMIYFFAYFWTSVQFQPKEMANQLRDYGSFVPGLRPGKRTADYLERVMMRITFVGAGFLCVIAVIPVTISAILKIPPNIAMFLGGTGLLIVVSVALDMVQRIEANLLMRNYGGFLGGEQNKSKRIRGRSN
jgi:preprotein translocase subunit SecY